MKATIESTNHTVTRQGAENYTARVWEGVTEAGVPFTAYIVLVQVHKDDDNSQFEAELQEHKQPSEQTSRAVYDMRYFVD